MGGLQFPNPGRRPFERLFGKLARLGLCRYLLQRVGVSECFRLSVGVFATLVYPGCVCNTHDNRRGQGGPGTGGVAAVVNWRSRVVA